MATFRMRPGPRKSDPNPQSSRSLSAKFGARLRARRTTISCCLSMRFSAITVRTPPGPRWLAILSDETGVSEVYLTTLPTPGSVTRVSSGGGTEPVWAKSSDQLYFRKDGEIFSVHVSKTGPLPGPPRSTGIKGFATGGDPHLSQYDRTLDRRDPVLLSATARAPFFSADGQWVGFVENNERLSKVPLTGGPAVAIGGRANAPRGISWGDDDSIVYATADPATGLMRTPSAGGEPTALTTADASRGEADHVFPDVLPRGRGILFTIVGSASAPGSHVALFDPKTGTYRVLIRDGAHPKYVVPGYIVCARAGSLQAVVFEPDRLEVVGTPVPVLEGVQTRPSGASAFGIASNGTLAYVGSTPAVERVPLRGARRFNGLERAVLSLDQHPKRFPVGARERRRRSLPETESRGRGPRLAR